MDHKVKKLEKSEVEITVTITKEEFQSYFKQACDNIAKEVNIKGFRPGHAPAHIIEEKIGKEAILYKAQDLAVQKTYPQIVVKEQLQVVAAPKIKVNSNDEPFEYVATVAIMPEVEVKDYKSIKVDKPEIKVTDKDVQEVVDDMLRYVTIWKDVERKAKKGDRAEVDFEGFDDGKPVENTKSTNHPVVIGDGTLIPGFEDNIVGMSVGEEKDFEITFPKDYHSKDFQNRKLKFHIKLNRLEEAEIPELSEETIEKLTGKKQDPEEFRKEIKENVKARRELEAKQKQENEYLEALLKKTKVEIPKSLIEEEVHYIIHEVKENIESRGMAWNQFLEQTKTTHEDLHKKYEPEAERRIKIRLALQHLIKEEKIEVSDEEVQKELPEMKKYNPNANERELKAQIKNRLALHKLFDKVLA